MVGYSNQRSKMKTRGLKAVPTMQPHITHSKTLVI